MGYRLELFNDRSSAEIDLNASNFDEFEDFLEELVEVERDLESDRAIAIALLKPLSGLSIPDIFRRIVIKRTCSEREILIFVQSQEKMDSLYRYLPEADQLKQKFQVGASSLRIQLADIVYLKTEAVVNASNTRLILGGGVSGAIAKLANTSLQAEMTALVGEGLDPGAVVITSAHGLPHAKSILHVASADGLPETIRKGIQNILRVVRERSISTVAIPALGTGTGGLSIQECAEIMLAEIDSSFSVVSPKEIVSEVITVLWTKADFDQFVEVAEQRFVQRP